MAKVLADFYYRWVKDRIRESFTVSGTISSTKEWIEVDTTLGAIQLELPDTDANDILNGKKIHIVDQGNAGTNNITIIPNGSDGTTIDGLTSDVISVNNTVRIYELVDNVWTVINRGSTTNQRSIFATDTALQSDDTIIANTSGGAFTLNLPTAIGIKGKKFLIKKVFGAANQLTIDPFGTETIDTILTVNLTGSGGAFIWIESDDANWIRIG